MKERKFPGWKMDKKRPRARLGRQMDEGNGRQHEELRARVE